MKQLLSSKAGVTVLEGVIALGLLALITSGAFGVLLSASRQTSTPDIREEMSYAVESANDLLKAYLYAQPAGSSVEERQNAQRLPSSLQCGPCGQSNGSGGCTATVDDHIYPTDQTPLATGVHYIGCLLPPICDRSSSEFSYTVASASQPSHNLAEDSLEPSSPSLNGYTFKFSIRCNGYEL